MVQVEWVSLPSHFVTDGASSEHLSHTWSVPLDAAIVATDGVRWGSAGATYLLGVVGDTGFEPVTSRM